MIEPKQHTAQDALSRDSLFDGRLVCLQHRRGYRFSLDAVLVAHFQPPSRGSFVLDLGAGCGIVGLIMMHRWSRRIREITAVEVQPKLAELAALNFSSNGFGDKCRVLCADLRDTAAMPGPETITQVVCNPPFYRQGSGRQSVITESLYARHQLLGDLEDFIRAAAIVLKNGGSMVMIYPAEGLQEMAGGFSSNGLEMKRLRYVYSYPDPAAHARLVIVQAVKKAGPGVRTLPPLYIYAGKNGVYSPEMQRFYDDSPSADPIVEKMPEMDDE